MDGQEVKQMVEDWLAKAQDPFSRMEAELNTAKEKIKQLEHEKEEDK